MKRTVWLVLDNNDQPINGAVHATEDIAKGFKLNGEEIVPAKLSWPYRGVRYSKLCLRKVISRKKEKQIRGWGAKWMLDLECGHAIKRHSNPTSGRGATIKKAQCDKCFLEGKRTGDAI